MPIFYWKWDKGEKWRWHNLKKKNTHTVNLHTEGGCSWPQFRNLHGIYALNAWFMIFGIKLYYLLVFIYIKLFRYVYIYFVFQLFYPKLRRLCFLSEAESIFRANREGFFIVFFSFSNQSIKLYFQNLKLKNRENLNLEYCFFICLIITFFFHQIGD